MFLILKSVSWSKKIEISAHYKEWPLKSSFLFLGQGCLGNSCSFAILLQAAMIWWSYLKAGTLTGAASHHKVNLKKINVSA